MRAGNVVRIIERQPLDGRDLGGQFDTVGQRNVAGRGCGGWGQLMARCPYSPVHADRADGAYCAWAIVKIVAQDAAVGVIIGWNIVSLFLGVQVGR